MKRLMTCMALFVVPMLAAPDKVTLCHTLSDPPKTMDVPQQAVDNHLAHGDYLGACVAPDPDPTEPAPTPEPGDPPQSSASPVISNMWLIKGDRIGMEDGFPVSIYPTYCILISDTHPSVEVQTAKCFPGDGWFPRDASCAGAVRSDDTWACDDELAEEGWTRLPLAELCQRHPQWCGR